MSICGYRAVSQRKVVIHRFGLGCWLLSDSAFWDLTYINNVKCPISHPLKSSPWAFAATFLTNPKFLHCLRFALVMHYSLVHTERNAQQKAKNYPQNQRYYHVDDSLQSLAMHFFLMLMPFIVLHKIPPHYMSYILICSLLPTI